jgi:type IV secretory pathway TraG/TraD family ATPase VirD4
VTAANNRRREPGKAGTDTALLVAAIAILGVLGVVWASVAVGSRLEHVNPHLPADPFAIAAGLARGRITWPATSSWCAAGLVALIAAAVIGVLALRRGRGGKRHQIDRAARYMATARQLQHLQTKQALATSRRLGIPDSPGIPLGRLIAGGQWLYSSFEDMITVIAGPRVGKSTSLVIPAITAAPGAVVTTSNKRDVLDATRDLRTDAGDVWVFDPQGVAREEPSWWWNPLSYVTDDVRAAKLAQYFAEGSRATDAKTDAFFDAAGQNLLAGLLLAAATAHQPIRDVFRWLTDPQQEEPVRLLRDGGYDLAAEAVLGVIQSTDKLRGSVYSTAQEMAACLKNTHVTDWVNPRPGHDSRPQFHPDTFVTGRGTLYSLSKEGAGTAGPLVTALTAATLEAATDLADISAGGRLQVPLVAILDEAANVCRWRDLPDLYSHFGSRGIPIMSVFQSWSQGVAVFGREGMLKLFSATNAFLYLGGVRENDFLQNLTEIIGDYDRETTTASHNRGVRSTSTALKRERILGVDELAALPRGRAILLTTGARPTLLRTIPWYHGAKATAARINASISTHDPGATGTPTRASHAQGAVGMVEPGARPEAAPDV